MIETLVDLDLIRELDGWLGRERERTREEKERKRKGGKAGRKRDKERA